MCGIAGQVSFTDEPVGERVLQLMHHAITHRGPDDEGCYLSPSRKVGFAHRRLSIIDLSKAGHMPMSDSEGKVWLIYNGEIYNFKELRENLQKKGYSFRSQSDTEVLLHLYKEYGEDCLAHIKGMFAFAIYDEVRDLLFAARDRVGIKPFYYQYNEKGFSFCSEIKGLATLPHFSKDIEPQAIYDFMTLRYIPAPLTPFKGILKLPPGHCLTLKGRDLKIRRYWQPEFHTTETNEDPVKRLEKCFLNSVEKHLMADVPLGVFLSGGVDSAAVVAAMRQLGVEEIKTFSIGYEDTRFSELTDAEFVAKQFKTDHHVEIMSQDNFWDTLDKYLYSMDEPVADLASIPLYLIAERASKHIKVVLSGEGADELLAGYGGFNQIQRGFMLMKAYQKLPGFIKNGLHGVSPFLARDFTDYFRQRPHVMTNILSETQKHSLLKGEDFESTDRIYKELLDHYRADDPMNQMLARFMAYWLPDDLLLKADKMTMASSIELRVPFLYEDMFDFAFSLPIHHKVRSGFSELNKKVVLKKWLMQHLPRSFVLKKKRGFGHPIYRWYEEDPEVRARVNESILSSAFIEAHFNLESVRSLVDSKAIPAIFNLFILSQWAKVHL